MRQKEIEIIIAPDGDVQIEGHGLVGPECLSLTVDLEQALGVVQNRQLTPDYRRRPPLVKRKH